ncbi:MAG: hypothetical protein WC337_02800 [Candidatus Muiribacteriota bacterium]
MELPEVICKKKKEELRDWIREIMDYSAEDFLIIYQEISEVVFKLGHESEDLNELMTILIFLSSISSLILKGKDILPYALPEYFDPKGKEVINEAN